MNDPHHPEDNKEQQTYKISDSNPTIRMLTYLIIAKQRDTVQGFGSLDSKRKCQETIYPKTIKKENSKDGKREGHS